MAASSVHVPRPCPISQQALTPTEAGWHCARCCTEVVDFTRLTEAEILAFLAGRAGQRVCAQVAAPLVPHYPRRSKGPGRWLLAALALAGAGPLLAHGKLPPLPPSWHKSLLFKGRQAVRLTVRGTVLDDSLNVPVPGAYVFMQGTRYGAITDERGEFCFSVASDWEPIRSDELTLVVSAGPFTFENQTVVVHFPDKQSPAPLLVRLRSRPGRGFIRGKARLVKPPVAPPGAPKK